MYCICYESICGPERAIARLCVCVCPFIWTISFERNDVTFYLDTFDLLVLLDLSSVRISDDQGQREYFLPENILAMCK